MDRQENPAKIYLRRYRALILRKESLRRSISEIYDRAVSITQAPKDVRVQGGGMYDRIAEDVAMITDAAEQLRDVERKAQEALEDILKAIEAVPDEMQKTVLTLRYVEGLGWFTVAERMNYEIANVYLIHGRALMNVKLWMIERGLLQSL